MPTPDLARRLRVIDGFRQSADLYREEIADHAVANLDTGAITSAHIATGAVGSDEIATGAVAVADIAQPAIGDSAAYPKTTDGVQTLLTSAAYARKVQVTVNVTEVFANGDGAQPTFKIGETDDDDSLAATTIFTDAAAGATFSFGGTITSGKALIVTAVAATGTTSTGAITVTASAVPEEA